MALCVHVRRPSETRPIVREELLLLLLLQIELEELEEALELLHRHHVVSVLVERHEDVDRRHLYIRGRRVSGLGSREGVLLSAREWRRCGEESSGRREG